MHVGAEAAALRGGSSSVVRCRSAVRGGRGSIRRRKGVQHALQAGAEVLQQAGAACVVGRGWSTRTYVQRRQPTPGAAAQVAMLHCRLLELLHR